MSKDKIQSYDADSIEVILDDIERIRKRTNMYIGYRQWKAVVHLLKEIIQNSVDEASAGVCDVIDVLVDEQTKTLSVTDNGRGCPQADDKLHSIATVIQSSGKFNKGKGNSYNKAAGKIFASIKLF